MIFFSNRFRISFLTTQWPSSPIDDLTLFGLFAALHFGLFSCQIRSNASAAAKSAQLQIPPVKPASDSNNNRASPVAGATSRTAKLASIGRAASEAVPSSSVSSTSILAGQNKTAIQRSPINKTHPHTSIFSSPCTQTTTEHNLNATNIFHANRTDANRRILDEDDDLLSEVQPDAVPTEVGD